MTYEDQGCDEKLDGYRVVNLRNHSQDKVRADLTHTFVITCISNPIRYRKRYELYHKFAAMCESAGVKLITVELAMGQREHMVTDKSNPYHVQLRSYEELWHKENMINIGIHRARHLDAHVDKVMWIDADLRPTRHPRDWFEETWHQLQHYEFVQMYSEFMDLDANSNTLGGISNSYMATYFKMGMTGPVPNDWCLEFPKECFDRHSHHRGHRHHSHHKHHDHRHTHHSGGRQWFGPPGGAWAANVSALDQIGGIPDRCILGSGDWHLACALTGSMSRQDPEMVNNKYTEWLFEIQERCTRWIKRDVGVVEGCLLHDSHGPKVNRGYASRKQILTLNDYDPYRDIKTDHQNVLQLETFSNRQIRLRDEVRQYFRTRNEDMLEFKKEKTT